MSNLSELSEYELKRVARIKDNHTHPAFQAATKHARDTEAQSRAKEAATKRRRAEKPKDPWLRCGKGHLLAPTTFAPNITCNGCARRAKPCTQGFACSECDYDMCGECVQKSGLQPARRSTRGPEFQLAGPEQQVAVAGRGPLPPEKPSPKRAKGGGSWGGSGDGHSWDELEAAFAAVRGSKVDHLSAHSNVRFGEETKKTCQVCLTKLKGAKQRYCVTITKGLHEQLEKSTKKVGRLQLTSATRRDQKATSHHGRHEFYVVASSKKIPAAALAAEVCLARKEMEGH